MTFRGLIGACVLLTAPAAAFGQKPTAAKQPVAADSAAAQPAEKQPAARIVVFRDSLVLIHCDTPPLFREMLLDAQKDARVRLRQVEWRTQGRDHPILLSSPETEYLKCAIFQVFS